jgi:hypothetical protein
MPLESSSAPRLAFHLRRDLKPRNFRKPHPGRLKNPLEPNYKHRYLAYYVITPVYYTHKLNVLSIIKDHLCRGLCASYFRKSFSDRFERSAHPRSSTCYYTPKTFLSTFLAIIIISLLTSRRENKANKFTSLVILRKLSSMMI